MTDRYIVEANRIDTINKLNCQKDVVGEKAYGLLMMPSSWTPSFFIISKKLYKHYIECKERVKKEKLVETYMTYINMCINTLNLQDANLIIRSSAVAEGMNERGKFESLKCTCDSFKEILIRLIEEIHENCNVPGNEMPFIVQEYINGSITGHLSNEYRFSKEIRDWKFQSECNGEISALTSLGIRNWREKIDADDIAKHPLRANSLKEALRLLASYYTSKQLRRHIEFVYDEHRLYAVQADEDLDDENEFSGANYMSIYRYKIKYNELISTNPDYIWEKSFVRGKFVPKLQYNRNLKLKHEYKGIYDIVKLHIDNWDCIGLLNMGCPDDEYDIETAAIVPVAFQADSIEELTEFIIETFTKHFGETYSSPRKEAQEVAKWIIKHKHEIDAEE